ncbi:hypothetical protein MAR_037836 [Mya arenaria]|uniref:Uncharacterized protein n=1 Tax=Mya arenaria TaxID=6604 RepID=A0ABY7FRG4_MYAAR|nr:hypothetical protein MAR_037836 [Mya arenaria]
MYRDILESVDLAGASIAMKLPVVLFSLFVVIKFVGKLTKCLRQKKYSRSRSEETTINLVTAFDFISHKYGLLTVAKVFACLTTIPCGLRNVYLVLMSYRRDRLRLYRGDRSFIPAALRNCPPNIYMN